MLPLSIVSLMWLAASPAPPSASASHRFSSVGTRAATGSGIGSPARTGHAAGELGGEVFWRQRQPRQAAPVERGGQVDDERQQPPLEGQRRRQVGPGLTDGAPPPFR